MTKGVTKGVTKQTTKGAAREQGQGTASESVEPHMPPASNCACIPYNGAWPPHRPIIHTPTSISHWMWTILPLQHTYVWQHVQTFHLTQNMQLEQNSQEWASAQQLLSVVEGTNQQYDGVEYTMSFLIM